MDGLQFSDLANLQITFTQDHQIMIERSLNDMTIDTEANTASFSLTQEETMQLKVGTVDKQIRLMNGGGTVTLTRIFRERVEPNIREDLING
jgi:hypothetical protein